MSIYDTSATIRLDGDFDAGPNDGLNGPKTLDVGGQLIPIFSPERTTWVTIAVDGRVHRWT
ncbi:hypothetical protein Pth03_18720 [Planotetraspora thailandica]|uniref:Uncharacterized protein n=1 Tax=Planotetraspora thailandica TaxID=487172 RepID=A0A8J3UYB6_9ACTN|nr:hypothetical protein Pth03_18720 [Planotetraspora thailandica]